MPSQYESGRRVEGLLGIGMQRETNTRDHKENQGREDGWEISQGAG